MEDCEPYPTLQQRLMASAWLPRLWLFVGTVGTVVIIFRAADLTPAALLSWPMVLWAAGVFALAVPIGLLISGLLMIIVLSPFYQLQARINGGPFQIEDRVRVLAGRHKGKVSTVYAHWQAGTVRVDLDPEAEEKFQDVFGGADLLLVKRRVGGERL